MSHHDQRHFHDVRQPVVEVDAQGRIIGVSSGKEGFDPIAYFDSIRSGSISRGLGEISATATITPGSLDGGEDGDLIAVNLTAGQTYSFNLRGTANGVDDPYLFLLDSNNLATANVLAFDDDGGLGLSSLLTFTATTSGTYYLYATSFDGGAADGGGYTVARWSPEADVPGSTNVAASLPTAAPLGLGTYYGNIDATGDNDYFKIDVEAGNVYSFVVSAGASTNAEFNVAGMGNAAVQLFLYNSSGTLIGSNFNFESALTYFASTNTTLYVRAAQGINTGGYTIDVEKIDPSTRDPLQSLNWDNAANIPTVTVNGEKVAYVYFGLAGENFGETAPNGSPMVTYGWNDKEKAAVMEALAQYTPITGIKYVVTTDQSIATFRLSTTANQPGSAGNYGAYFYPQDPAYGTQKGIGVFNVNSGGWDKPGVSLQDIPGDQLSLDRGGFSFAVILHEFGHGHGIAHPHDRGGGSEIMLGVTGATGSLGVYNLNQGVYTVMSYNDAWQLHPNGASPFTIAGIDNGWSGTLGAFDIAVLQARYGIHAYNGGNNTYTLTDVADDAFYQTIWDSGGNDTISYGGALNAQIDLTAATLDYTPTGGGVVSFLYNAAATTPANNSFQVRGGYTIANGVVIENATGGSGNDVLIGNSAANTLTGNAGNDSMLGRGGNDTMLGGAGNDTLKGDAGNDRLEGGDGDDILEGGDGADIMYGGDGFDTASWASATAGVKVSVGNNYNGDSSEGDKFYSIEKIEGSQFADELKGGNSADTLFGLGGNDKIEGGNDKDTLDGGAGEDRLDGGNDNDSLSGGADNDILIGGNGNDVLDGGSGNDRLEGGNGNDTLNGGAGNDILEGGNGTDLYVFSDAGTDTIVGYQRGEDIDLKALNVTMADVSIYSNRIVVDIDGAEDLTIMFNTSSFSSSDLIFV